MKQISLFIPLLGTLLLSGCAGTSTEFECNATTSDTCMTMEQANEKAKKLEQSSEAKPVAASLPRLAEGNFRTMPEQTVTADHSVRQQTCGDSTSGAETAGTTPAVYRCPGSENGRSGQFSCTGNTSPSAKNG
nr:type IV conjugative transfer system lipoprotein TraV [Escherichia coli]